MGERIRLGFLLRFCCAVTSADPEILSQCNNVDKRRIARHAVALLCTFTMAAVLWSAVFSEMLPVRVAIASGLFAGLIIYLLDLAIATSDWELKGVLRDRATFSLESVRSSFVRMIKFGCRMVLALTLAVVTGTYVTLFWFNDTIENFIHQQRLALNAPIEEAYRIEREKLQGQLIDPLHKDVAMAMEQRRSAQNLLEDSQAKMKKANDTVTAARLDMHREEAGLGRAAGRGPLWRDAQIRLEEAQRHAAMAQGEVDHARAHLQEIDSRIKNVNTRLQEAGEALAARTAVLAAERDARLVPERSDFLMKFRALEELKRDPVYGTSMTFVAWLTKLTIVIFELIFIIILLNDHASLYTLHLLYKTRLEAQKIDAEYVRARAIIDASGAAVVGAMSQEAFEGAEDRAPENSQAHAAPAAASDPSDASQASDERGSCDRPIFDVPAHPTQNSSDDCEATRSDSIKNDAAVSGKEEVLYPVVGGNPGERVSTTEALADNNRYWVNPENPDEIWDRQYYEVLRGMDSGKDAA